MRVLHFVERDAEGGSIVLATSDGHEQFEVTIDSPLRDAVAGTQPAPETSTAAPGRPQPTDSRLSPREIQTRVRAGETPQDLADEHGAGLDWVLRFAGPVLGERDRVVDEARRAKARRSTTDGQLVDFGPAVDGRFAAHGIDPAGVRWDASRRDGGPWTVSAQWIGGQAEHSARWTFQLAARSVTPADDTAADLLSDRPIRPIAAPVLSLAPALVPFPAMPEAHTGPLPRVEEVFDQAQFSDDPTPSAEPSAPSAALLEPEQNAELAEPVAEEPQLPLDVVEDPDTSRIPKLTNLGIARRDEHTESRSARRTVPSWDDILLGVRRNRD
jgi:hypothetical protein